MEGVLLVTGIGQGRNLAKIIEVVEQLQKEGIVEFFELQKDKGGLWVYVTDPKAANASNSKLLSLPSTQAVSALPVMSTYQITYRLCL